MHDRVRVREQDIDPAARAKVAEKISKYCALSSACKDKKASGSRRLEDLESSRLLLEINPEFYTFYNYRREVIIDLLRTTTPANPCDVLLLQELEFSTRQIKRDYKSYCTWHHRKWIFDQLKEHSLNDLRAQLLNKERLQAEGLLKLDERNFHAWGYRRWIMAQLEKAPDAQEEATFTESKIGSSFSNYSAWHARVPIMRAHPERVPREVTMALQAFYCDPMDQSTFLYVDWLVGQQPSTGPEVVTACEELLSMEGDIKWPLWMLWRITKKMDYIRRLIAVDPGHKGYYEDMMPK